MVHLIICPYSPVFALCHAHFYFHQFRVHWYIIAAMSDDERAQREGFVTVAYNVQVDIASLFKVPVFASRKTRMRECLPMRPSAIHFCYNDIRLRPFISLYQKCIGTHGRVRFRAHFGSHTECQYALMSFGIMPDCLPVDTEGNKNCVSLNQWIEKQKILEAGINKLGAQDNSQMDECDQDIWQLGLSQLELELSKIKKKPAYDKAKFLWPTSVTDPVFCLQFLRAAHFNPHKAAQLLLESLPCVNEGHSGLSDLMEWLEKRKEELQFGDDTDLIHFPSVTDILLGRGFCYQHFPGNLYFITVIEMNKEIYDDAGSDQVKKFVISKEVLRMTHESGARFLQRADIEKDGWLQVDDQAARKKISHAFRNLRRRK
jgi:hypothetical protein